MRDGSIAAGSRAPPERDGPPPIWGVPTVAKVYDLYYREGSARHLGISIPHAIAAHPFKAARREPKRANVDQGHARVLRC
jgi:hypothetical protein